MQKEIEKEVPEGVKIISVVSYTLTGILFILGLFSIKFGETISSISDADKAVFSTSQMTLPSSANMVWLGIIFIILAVFLYFIGRDIAKFKNWARIAGGIVSLLIFIMSIINLFQGSLSSLILLIVSGIIVWYLFLNKKVLKQFR
jgi:hypothetical protein